MAFGNFSFGGGYFAEGANVVTGGDVFCHGYISDFDPFGAGGMISDMPSGSQGSISDRSTTGGYIRDKRGDE